MKKVSINDIAKKAGVAKSTVSNALNPQSTKISDSKREYILQIVDEMGYVPSRNAQKLSSQEFSVIGFFMISDSNERFSQSMINQKWIYFLNKVCNDKDIELVNIVIDVNEDDKLGVINSKVSEYKISGMVIQGLSDEPVLIDNIASIPVHKVFIDVPIINNYSTFVSVDNFQAQKQLTELMLKNFNPKSILLIPGDENAYVSRERVSGFNDAVRGFNHRIDALVGSFEPKDIELQLDGVDLSDYDLIVTGSDKIAMTVSKNMPNASKSIITGFDADNYISFSNFQIFSIDQHVENMAVATIENLLNPTSTTRLCDFSIVSNDE